MNLRVCQGSNQCISFSCISSSICDNVHLSVCFQRVFFYGTLCYFSFTEGKIVYERGGQKVLVTKNALNFLSYFSKNVCSAILKFYQWPIWAKAIFSRNPRWPNKMAIARLCLDHLTPIFFANGS